MIKKIIIFCIFLALLTTCGKKADPEYKVKKNKFLTSKV